MSLSIDSSLRELLQLVGAISSPKYKQSLTAAVDDRDFNFLLRQAAFKSSGISILKFLLEKRDVFEIDLNARGKASGTALDIALKVNNLEAIKLLQSQVGTFASSIAALQLEVPKDNFTKEPVFIITNDKVDIDSVFKYHETPSSGEVFLGISGLSALDFVNEGIEYILMVDTSTKVKAFWENIGEIITNSQNRLDCIEKIRNHILLNEEQYQITEESAEYFKTTKVLAVCWLLSDEYFCLVSKIFKQQKFAFLQADLTNVATTKRIREIFNLKGLSTGAAYLTNLHDCIGNFAEYGEALKYLLDAKTNVIDTYPPKYKYSRAIELLKGLPVKIGTFVAYQMLSDNPLDYAGLVSQRIINRAGLSIEQLYPIIGVIKQLRKGEDVFLKFGLKMGYFTEQEVQDNDNFLREKINELIKIETDQVKLLKLIRKAIANRLYPGEKSSGGARGSSVGGGGGSK